MPVLSALSRPLLASFHRFLRDAGSPLEAELEEHAPPPRPRLVHNAREILRFGPLEGLAYDAVIRLGRLTGLLDHPLRAQGDFEHMGFLDLAYWAHKAERPMRRARKGSGLEAYFERARRDCAALPAAFEVISELDLSAVGDLMSHPFLEASRDTLYAEVAALIFGADLAMANLECPVVRSSRPLIGTSSAAPVLHYAPETLSAASRHGSDGYAFMTLACNHTLDFGIEGARSTVAALRSQEIAFNGINETEADAARATILERRGIRLGVVGYTFGLNGQKPPPDRPWLVNRMPLNEPIEKNDFAQLRAQLAHCRDAGVDFVIAQLHWGLEFEFYPTPEQVELAHHLAELGVDAIFGHHPHVLQPMELYQTRRDPRRRVPIFYSLGNLVNPFSAPFMCRSGVARVRLAKGAHSDGERSTYVASAELLEVDQKVDEEAGRIWLTPAS